MGMFRPMGMCRLEMPRAFEIHVPSEISTFLEQAFVRIFARFSRSFREFSQVLSTFLRFSDLLGPVRMRSDAFGCIRMHLDAFGCVRTRPENFGNFV